MYRYTGYVTQDLYVIVFSILTDSRANIVIKGLFTLLLPLILISACSHQSVLSIPEKANYFVANEHGKEISSKELIQQLVNSDVIYLGEIHDNPDHHATQLDIIKKLIGAGKKPVIGFEFFSREQTSWLLSFTSKSKHSFRPLTEDKASELLRHRLGWNQREDWNFYYPFLELAKKHDLQVFGADIHQGIRIRMARAGIDNMMSIEKNDLPSKVGEDSEEYKQLIYQELREGHCNMASDELVTKLYKTISLRNAYMAQSIHSMFDDQSQKQKEPIVMILGRGHIDYDAGVKSQLQHLNPSIRQLNIGLYENNKSTADDHIQKITNPVHGLNRHNLYAITADRSKKQVDHCAAFKKHKSGS